VIGKRLYRGVGKSSSARTCGPGSGSPVLARGSEGFKVCHCCTGSNNKKGALAGFRKATMKEAPGRGHGRGWNQFARRGSPVADAVLSSANAVKNCNLTVSQHLRDKLRKFPATPGQVGNGLLDPSPQHSQLVLPPHVGLSWPF
jgi:hypothetical protein